MSGFFWKSKNKGGRAQDIDDAATSSKPSAPGDDIRFSDTAEIDRVSYGEDSEDEDDLDDEKTQLSTGHIRPSPPSSAARSFASEDDGDLDDEKTALNVSRRNGAHPQGAALRGRAAPGSLYSKIMEQVTVPQENRSGIFPSGGLGDSENETTHHVRRTALDLDDESDDISSQRRFDQLKEKIAWEKEERRQQTNEPTRNVNLGEAALVRDRHPISSQSISSQSNEFQDWLGAPLSSETTTDDEGIHEDKGLTTDAQIPAEHSALLDEAQTRGTDEANEEVDDFLEDDIDEILPDPVNEAHAGVLQERARAIELLILDVDGVLTDGGLYYGSEGEAFKRFHVQDGHGIVLAQKVGLQIAILTARTSQIVEYRSRELGIETVFQGRKDKMAGFEALLGEVGIDASRVAYMGDDINDLNALRRARLSACPADACPEVRERVDIVVSSTGGNGAVREFIEFILKAQGKWASIVEGFFEAQMKETQSI